MHSGHIGLCMFSESLVMAFLNSRIIGSWLFRNRVSELEVAIRKSVRGQMQK